MCGRYVSAADTSQSLTPSVISQYIYGNVKERRRWDQAIPLRCHGPFESRAVIGPLIPKVQNKHGGPNESNKKHLKTNAIYCMTMK